VVLVTLPTFKLNPVVSLEMLYPKPPPDPGVEAFQANETLLPVVAVTWKLPGVPGGVGPPLLSILWACKESMATAIPSATTLAAVPQNPGLEVLTPG
jgi:hypothetical protein